MLHADKCNKLHETRIQIGISYMEIYYEVFLLLLVFSFFVLIYCVASPRKLSINLKHGGTLLVFPHSIPLTYPNADTEKTASGLALQSGFSSKETQFTGWGYALHVDDHYTAQSSQESTESAEEFPFGSAFFVPRRKN